ncbi:MAG: aminotransferase class V-fold PLP-dependent enzyme [Bacteroidia bacterium]|nr:aminotransferase class V-fold PLP-dependent enzyme [Bacteroidia bacterium]
MNRRDVVKSLGAGLLSVPLLNLPFGENEDILKFTPAEELSDDEKFWKKFSKKYYKLSKDFINLENGYFGVQPKPVLEAYQANIEKVNSLSSKFMRQNFYKEDYPKIKQMLAEMTGVSEDELLITRNATEALNILIQGIDWKKGDEVILQYHDYHSMIETFKMLEKQKGIVLKFLDVPLKPKKQEELVELYKAACTSNTRVILLTYLTHLTGQIMPVHAIGKFARSKGIDVIVDAAHSFAQIHTDFPHMNADFIGVNLHKWLGNPLGAGLMYIKKDRIKEIKPLFGDFKRNETSINKLGHYGTPATPIVMTIAEAVRFHLMVGGDVKEERLNYLKHYWTRQAKEIDRVEITTPLGSEQSCALASFRLDGVPAEKVVERLDKEFNVFTVIRRLHNSNVVRVTPNLYNSTKDLDRLLEGIASISR